MKTPTISAESFINAENSELNYVDVQIQVISLKFRNMDLLCYYNVLLLNHLMFIHYHFHQCFPLIGDSINDWFLLLFNI